MTGNAECSALSMDPVSSSDTGLTAVPRAGAGRGFTRRLTRVALLVIFGGKNRPELQKTSERAVPERRAEAEEQARDEHADDVDLAPPFHPLTSGCAPR